jgi:hypothetical protein
MSRGAGIGFGVIVGGLLGAASRPAVLYAFWLRGADPDASLALVAVSAGFGGIIGVAAVLIAALVRHPVARPIVAAAVGGALAYGAAILTFLPLFWGGLLGFGGVKPLDEEAPLYGIAMGLTGALAGGVGALVLGWVEGKRPALATDH